MAWDESHHCQLLAGLVPDQFQMCQRNLEVMPSIVQAAHHTKSICQNSFADMRWNCSSIHRAPSFGPDLLKGKGCFSRCARAPLAAPRTFPGRQHSSLQHSCSAHGGQFCLRYVFWRKLAAAVTLVLILCPSDLQKTTGITSILHRTSCSRLQGKRAEGGRGGYSGCILMGSIYGMGGMG